MEPNQVVTRTSAASDLVALTGESSSRSQLTTTRTQSVPQPAVVLPGPPASQTSVWQGFIEKVTGQRTIFPVVAYPLTVNATPHWFEDSGFVSKERPFTKRLLVFGSKREPMLSLLQGDFELAVVDFALPSEASQRDRSQAEETFHYLIGKVGYCYKKGDRYLTHLYVYPLGSEEPLPGLLQGVSALQGERSANMLLGLLVRMGLSQTRPPATELRSPVEEETQVRAETRNVAFHSCLPNGDIDERIQMNRTETLRRDPRLDPQLSSRAPVAMHPIPPPPFQLAPSIFQAAQVPSQESPPPVQNAHQRAHPVEPVNDSYEEINCLNAENDQAFYRLTPIGQRIPVLLNRVPENRGNPRLKGNFNS